MKKTVNADETVAAEHGWRFRRTVPSLPEVHRSITVPNGRKVLGYCSQAARIRPGPIGCSRLLRSGELGHRPDRDAQLYYISYHSDHFQPHGHLFRELNHLTR